MCIFEWNFKIVLDMRVGNNCFFKKGVPRRHPPSWSIPRSALKTLFVQHEILNPQACVRRAPAPNRHAVWMEKVSATCNGAVLDSHPCMPDGAGWAESKAVQCRSVSKKPAFQLTTVSALTSNHGSIAWGKPRLPRCPVPEPRASPWGTGRYLLSWPISRQVLEVSLLPLLTKGLLGDPCPCGSGITHAWSQGCGYFGRLPSFLNASEIEVAPLQQESTRDGISRTAFELGTVIFPKLFFSRKLLLWEKLLTKRWGCA